MHCLLNFHNMHLTSVAELMHVRQSACRRSEHVQPPNSLRILALASHITHAWHYRYEVQSCNLQTQMSSQFCSETLFQPGSSGMAHYNLASHAHTQYRVASQHAQRLQSCLQWPTVLLKWPDVSASPAKSPSPLPPECCRSLHQVSSATQILVVSAPPCVESASEMLL